MSVSTITPKQQSFVRSLLEERLDVLGIDDVDSYIREKGIDRLTARSASLVIEQLKGIPCARRPEHAHLPEGRVIVNRYTKPCVLCTQPVEAGQGYAIQTTSGWQTAHHKADCVEAPSTLESIDVGYYAFPSITGNNDLDFFAIHTNRGVKEIHRIIGGHPDQRVNSVERVRVSEYLESLSREELFNAQALFGREIGKCGRCGRHLTDETSRAIGLGSDCASKGF